MLYDKDKWYLRFDDYHDDGGDGVVELTKEEFDALTPFARQMQNAYGDDYEDVVDWEDISRRKEDDLRPSEMDRFYGYNVLVYSLC